MPAQVDLGTSYLGLRLAHPLVASASPLGKDLDGIRRLEDAGAAAVVLPSIYEEEVEAANAINIALADRRSTSERPSAPFSQHRNSAALDARLDVIRRASRACGIPIIASLNGSAPTRWVSIAREVEAAGAAAIELNLYRVPANLEESGQAVEERWLATVAAVRGGVSIPVAVKLGPWLSAPGHFCKSLVAAGADGLVLFNRFYQPDTDLDTLQIVSNLQLSTPYEMRPALLWISLLAGHIDASLAATGGVDTSEQVVKYLLAGADVVMTASALLRHGAGHIGVLRRGLEEWMQDRGFASLTTLRGRLSAAAITDPEPLLRAQYVDMLLTHPGTQAP
jgi:dihydroorotate dehydrogenase (fumarate)